MWAATRVSLTDPFEEPIHLPINSPEDDGGPNISDDGSTLYFISFRSGGLGKGDVWQVRVIPEPTTFLLATIALLGLLCWRREEW